MLTIFFPAAILLLAPGDLGRNLIWLGLSVPLLWAGAMLYSYWDEKSWRPLVAMGFLSASSVLVILISEPLI